MSLAVCITNASIMQVNNFKSEEIDSEEREFQE